MTGKEEELKFFVPAKLLGGGKQMPVEGAEANWTPMGVELKLKLPAMSPAIICIGDAAKR